VLALDVENKSLALNLALERPATMRCS
jgi:hypothetical protein